MKSFMLVVLAAAAASGAPRGRDTRGFVRGLPPVYGIDLSNVGFDYGSAENAYEPTFDFGQNMNHRYIYKSHGHDDFSPGDFSYRDLSHGDLRHGYLRPDDLNHGDFSLGDFSLSDLSHGVLSQGDFVPDFARELNSGSGQQLLSFSFGDEGHGLSHDMSQASPAHVGYKRSTPITKLFTYKQVVEVPKMVGLKRIVAVPKIVSVPKMIHVSKLMEEPRFSYSAMLGGDHTYPLSSY